MRIFLTGVSCVGKTVVGEKLADRLGVRFFDLDQEIERFFGTSIQRLQSKFLTMHSYRIEAAKALVQLLKHSDSRSSVIALPPSGLMGGYLAVVKKTDGICIALDDEPENILKRITSYDLDSKPIERHLTSHEKRLYLREIKKDITYFGKSYGRAHLRVDISGLNGDQAASKVKTALDAIGSLEITSHGTEQAHALGRGIAGALARR